MTKPTPRFIKRMIDARNHPNVIVRQAAMAALRDTTVANYNGVVKSLDAFGNLYNWLDRIEPKWKTARRVTWSTF